MHHRILFLLTIPFILSTMNTVAATLTVNITDDKDRPLPDAVVYLKSANTDIQDSHAEVEIEQIDKTFQPFVSVVTTGTRAFFPNRDGIGHHVYSFSPSKPFQLPLSEQVNTDSVVLDKPGVVTVGCNIHDWMVGYIYVVDTPYTGKSGPDGSVIMSGIPEGGHEVHVWHPGIKGDEISQDISAGTDPLQLEFSLPLKPEYFWRPPVQDDDDEY